MSVTRRTSLPFAALVVALLAPAGPAAAADPVDFTLPVGTACPGFALRAQAPADERELREFTNRDGEVVRLLRTGTDVPTTLTNVDTGKTLTLPGRGAVTTIRIGDDGTATVTSTGHLFLTLFPSDVPAGPSTELIVGRVVFTVSPDGLFTVVSVRGKRTDLCAALV